ncbi:hypothetical protein AMTR_s00059p00124020 [Amborella trichopoda]|uniref:Uncharacterized protein n=1 Tax=Amborella trichopoda TaxID=13333 RepID=U5DAZ2_AMBTC|nr:hypothetical protein AMTR_s00059p00124020 [Amborella trichopoda]
MNEEIRRHEFVHMRGVSNGRRSLKQSILKESHTEYGMVGSGLEWSMPKESHGGFRLGGFDELTDYRTLKCSMKMGSIFGGPMTCATSSSGLDDGIFILHQNQRSHSMGGTPYSKGAVI